ncbi:DUF4344 domain-containing metallopeptidase [Streptomyces xanthochromogenes]|uniref:DUF4344 domain-containing metallopeptidase n=1 Tax=Streptomyces TaxID=1883 RepID=UPI001368F26F|nr:DUF4344 domain-containing metallopeptidase [Streptomyces sp. SID1034]MYV95119.1 hypothetical protein [Streptomyces sp. SID1034]
MAPRGVRHILGAGLSATLLLSCTTNGGDKSAPEPARPSGSGFTIRYEEPTAADRPSASFLRDRNTAATATHALNTLLTLNQRITVASRSCNGEGSAYDPQTRTIELCYDDTTDDRALFQNAGRHPADDETAAIATETLYHEAGHALADLLDLPLTNRQEEDAADQFAALMLLRTGPTGERQLRTAAEAYELTTTTQDQTDSRDEHSPNPVRAANHLCYLYGAAPDHNKDLTTTGRLPSARATTCAQEWAEARTAWMTRLQPLLREQSE